MEESVGKITFGYVWRLIVWSLLFSFVFVFIVGLILGTGSINSLDSIEKIISIQKKRLVATLIISLIGTVVSCKFATSGIQKKFTINENNAKKVFKSIIIVLIIFTVLYIAYYLINVSNLNDSIETLKSLDKDILNDFGSFCKTYSIISVILNSLVMLAMIPFEKKLLNV